MTQINGEVLPNFLKTHAGFDAKILIPDSATGWKPLVVKQFKNMDMLKILNSFFSSSPLPQTQHVRFIFNI